MAAGGALWLGLVVGGAVCLGTGCTSLAYYAQAVNGHLNLLQQARPVAEWSADDNSPAALRQRLALSQRLRDFAVHELHLPDNDSYRRYADLQRSAAVWNVVATPELSLQLKTWCFPVLGCVGYRGYYAREAAESLAMQLREEGLETRVYGVPAYSTLGWSNWVGGDPLLNTFIAWPEADLARLIFHELAHQVVYVDDDTTFNESFATAVERLGGERWLARHADEGAREADARSARRRQEFREFTLRWREQLDALYRAALADEAKREGKALLMERMRAEYQQLKDRSWGGFAGYDEWIASANNASFAVQAAYNELVPHFERLFQRSGGDFPRFYAEVRALAELPREQRRERLQAGR